MDRIPLQLSFDFESATNSSSVQRVAQEATPSKAGVVCLKQFRNSRLQVEGTDTTLLYKSILDSIRHFA